jgi:hypothetical protein
LQVGGRFRRGGLSGDVGKLTFDGLAQEGFVFFADGSAPRVWTSDGSLAQSPAAAEGFLPPPVLGTFIDRALAVSSNSASSSLAAAAGMGSSSSAGFQELEVQTRALIAVQTANDSADRVGDVIAVDHVNRGIACPLVHRYGLGHLVHRFRSLWAPF